MLSVLLETENVVELGVIQLNIFPFYIKMQPPFFQVDKGRHDLTTEYSI